jgi:pimeloyl-ACP methyl ester carboxylesterase
MKKLRKNEKVRQLLISILIAVFFPSLVKANNPENEFDWFDDAGFEYIGGEVTWSKGDHIIEKGLYIEYGGVLTIEAGANIVFKNNPDMDPFITIYDGRIIANGTKNEKITISSLEGNSMIRMADNGDNAASFFRYVDFVGTANVISGGGMMSFWKNLLAQKVLAASEYRFSNVFTYEKGKVHIENSTFKDSSIRLDSFIGLENNENGLLEVINSNFDLSEIGTAISSSLRCDDNFSLVECKNRFLLKNNWYGNIDGPDIYEGTWHEGKGVRIVGKFLLDDWRKNDLIVDPVVIVPGIMGSGQSMGKWKLDPITHTYDDLVASLLKNGYQKDFNLFEFPYEWRNNNETTARFLQSKIEYIIGQSGVSKVDVVAHSMGGLVARAYIEEIDGAQYDNTIDELITLGTPQKGSPAAYLKWEAGEGFFTWSEKILKNHFKQEAEHAGYDDLQKYIQEKIPSVGELLPDYDYLLEASSGNLREYSDQYPRNTFLEDLNAEKNLEKMSPVEHINIVGNLENDESTISKIRVITSNVENKWKDGMPENFYDKNTDRGLNHSNGDETVPEKSAKGIGGDKMIEIKTSHQDLPDEAQCEVLKELTGKLDCEKVDKWHITNVLLIKVFSPIDIQVISPTGKKYGKDFENKKEFEPIDGSYYSGFESKNEFLTIPNTEDGEYQIITQGTGLGDYRIEATKITDNDFNEAIEYTATYEGTASEDNSDQMIALVTGSKVTNPSDVSETPSDDANNSGGEFNNGQTENVETDTSSSKNKHKKQSDDNDKESKDSSDKVISTKKPNLISLVEEQKALPEVLGKISQSSENISQKQQLENITKNKEQIQSETDSQQQSQSVFLTLIEALAFFSASFVAYFLFKRLLKTRQ